MAVKTIRVGNASGFWGDDLFAFKRQLTKGNLHYLNADFLAEVTMSILQKQQQRDQSLGYISDFIDVMSSIAPIVKEKKVKIITNAGGNNPLDCALKLQEILKKMDINLSIGVAEGDNIFHQIETWHQEGEQFVNLETQESFNNIKDQLQSASVYSGMWPLVELLKKGVDIVIAGRVADPAMTMAPLAYEFGWAKNDWDKLASALVAGHVLECGGQASGGNYTDWHKVKQWSDFGYPIIEMSEDGSFLVTKAKDTGGLVNADTVREQLIYEIGNPYAYMSPDVTVDFTSFKVEDISENLVKISPAKGMPPTPTLKASMAYNSGFMSSGSVIISGNKSVEKARIFEKIFWERLGEDFEKKDTSYVGFNSCHKSLVAYEDSNEVLLRFSVYDKDRKKIQEFSKMISALILTGPQGVAVTGGRAPIRSVVGFWPALVGKDKVVCRIKKLEDADWQYVPSETGFEEPFRLIDNSQVSEQIRDINFFIFPNAHRVKIYELCLGRSGDKGDTTNIGLIARNESLYEFIKQYITADFVKSQFKDICKGKVSRYELDNLHALNFLLESSLNGGGTRSLWIDAQGKTYAAALLNQYIDIPKDLYETLK